MGKIISCDWGTSALRLRVVDTNEGIVLGEIKSQQGISNTFELWKRTKKKETGRISFYRSILDMQIKKLEQRLAITLEGIPLVVSGMASSSIGMIELPYKEIPFKIDAAGLNIKIIEAARDFKHTILLISGVKSTNDAMRGEETQLIGCNISSGEEQYFIFPGTHSKHIKVKAKKIIDIKTYMTGEFFSLLAKKSILSEGLTEVNDFRKSNYKKSFRAAVRYSVQNNLLHSSFLTRTNYLFGKLSPEENYCYLSGLIIGAELKDLLGKKNAMIHLVGNADQLSFYKEAINVINEGKNYFIVKSIDADEALVKGHLNACKVVLKMN